jgi:hypothetical protein
MHDPEVYKDPMADRLIAKPGKPVGTLSARSVQLAFGSERRWVSHTDRGRIRDLLHPRVPNSACPREQLAQSTLFIFAATVLSVFDYDSARPKPFLLSELESRSAKAETLIRSRVVPSHRSPAWWFYDSLEFADL